MIIEKGRFLSFFFIKVKKIYWILMHLVHVFTDDLFSREFYYIQMEKYARQALSEGIKNPDDLRVALDSELYRVLNLHYNRNNHIEVRI